MHFQLPLLKRSYTTRPYLAIIKLLSNTTLYYFLTYSMVQSPSWEANWFAASQEILRISRNPKVHYRTHKRPPPVSILGQPNPGHIPTSHLLEIRPNIIHPSTPRSPQWFLPSGFPSKTLYTPFSSPIRVTCPYYTALYGLIYAHYLCIMSSASTTAIRLENIDVTKICTYKWIYTRSKSWKTI